MFPLPQSPGDKQCPQCGGVVSPNWQLHSLDNGEIGWVGVSLCPACGHKGFMFPALLRSILLSVHS